MIFDEAQRAWNREMTSEFMRRKKGVPEFKQSEPEFLISYMDRHPDWTVVVCLVGGGQEINRGEAGISAWLDAVRSSLPIGRLCSPELTDSEYAAGHALQRLRDAGMCTRTPRSTSPSRCDRFAPRTYLPSLKRFWIARWKTRGNYCAVSLIGTDCRDPQSATAKRWVREHARGTERYGLVASSGAQRLKPHAIDVRVNVNPVHWFLDGIDDTRSSYYLEDAATEFQVQGLELDWVSVTWDADYDFGRLAGNTTRFLESAGQMSTNPTVANISSTRTGCY